MKFRLSVLLVLLLFSAVSGINAATEIILKTGKISLAQKKIYLKDIAEIKNADESIKDKLNEIYIQRAAYPGKKAVVTKMRVLNLVRKYYGDVPIKGPDKIYVNTLKAEVSETQIIEKAETYLKNNMPWSSEDARIKIKGVNGDLNVVDGTVLLKIKQEGNIRLKGNVIVPVEIYVDGRFNKTVSVSAFVEVITDCIISTRDIRRRESVNGTKAKIIRKDITYIARDVVSNFDQLSNKVLKRAVPKGVILTEDMFESIPLFRRSDTVPVILTMNSLRIETQGEALSDGKEGAAVKVQLVTGKIIEGIVDSSGKVIIEK